MICSASKVKTRLTPLVLLLFFSTSPSCSVTYYYQDLKEQHLYASAEPWGCSCLPYQCSIPFVLCFHWKISFVRTIPPFCLRKLTRSYPQRLTFSVFIWSLTSNGWTAWSQAKRIPWTVEAVDSVWFFKLSACGSAQSDSMVLRQHIHRQNLVISISFQVWQTCWCALSPGFDCLNDWLLLLHHVHWQNRAWSLKPHVRALGFLSTSSASSIPVKTWFASITRPFMSFCPLWLIMFLAARH